MQAAKTEITEAERGVPLTREQRLKDISFEGIFQAIDMDDDGKITKGECERAVSGKFKEQFKSNYQKLLKPYTDKVGFRWDGELHIYNEAMRYLNCYGFEPNGFITLKIWLDYWTEHYETCDRQQW